MIANFVLQDDFEMDPRYRAYGSRVCDLCLEKVKVFGMTGLDNGDGLITAIEFLQQIMELMNNFPLINVKNHNVFNRFGYLRLIGCCRKTIGAIAGQSYNVQFVLDALSLRIR